MSPQLKISFKKKKTKKKKHRQTKKTKTIWDLPKMFMFQGKHFCLPEKGNLFTTLMNDARVWLQF